MEPYVYLGLEKALGGWYLRGLFFDVIAAERWLSQAKHPNERKLEKLLTDYWDGVIP